MKFIVSEAKPMRVAFSYVVRKRPTWKQKGVEFLARVGMVPSHINGTMLMDWLTSAIKRVSFKGCARGSAANMFNKVRILAVLDVCSPFSSITWVQVSFLASSRA